MRITFETEKFADGREIIRAEHGSNGAIMATGKTKARALLGVLECARQAFVTIGEPSAADTLKRAMDRIQGTLDRKGE